jgi:hypothetical protein
LRFIAQVPGQGNRSIEPEKAESGIVELGLSNRARGIPMGREAAGMLFMKLVVQFVHLLFCPLEGFPAGGCDLVNPASAATDIFGDRLQKSCALQSVEQRIKSSRADAISVVRELLHHR